VSTSPIGINRRLFLKAAAPFTLSLSAIVRGQVVIERGRFSEDDLPWARNRLLELANAERSQARLSLLELDDLAGKVANEHARDMVTGQFLSHWGTDGRKPYQRYSFSGGIDATQENAGRADNIESVTPYGVARDLADMHTSMYLETPPNDGHRRAILFPPHTHVGFGIALKDHNLRLVEIYVSRYVHVDPVQQRAKRKATVLLTGRLRNAKHFLREVDVCYEPLPTPPDENWLHTLRPYSLPDDFVALRPRTTPGTRYNDGTTGDYDCDDKGWFRVPVKLYKDTPGIYTIVFWIRRVSTEKAFPATGICIQSE